MILEVLPYGLALPIEPQKRAFLYDHQLALKQHEVLVLFAKGLSTIEIARQQGITELTVETHMVKVRNLFDTHTTGNALLIALQLKIIDINEILNNKEIAEAKEKVSKLSPEEMYTLFISIWADETTKKTLSAIVEDNYNYFYLTSIYRKIGAKNRTHAISLLFAIYGNTAEEELSVEYGKNPKNNNWNTIYSQNLTKVFLEEAVVDWEKNLELINETPA